MKPKAPDSREWTYELFDIDAPADSFDVFEPIVELWRSKKGDRRFPAWSDFEFTEFSGWYGYMAVCDLEFEPIFDINFRLWGTHVVDILKYDLTNRSPRLNRSPPFEYMGGYSQVEMDFLETIATRPAIGVTEGSVDWDNRSYVAYREIALPLADDGEAVDKIWSVLNRMDRSRP